MRKLVLHMMMSLDGFVAPVDGSEEWMTSPDPGRDTASLALANDVDLAIAGHGVYPDMAGYWPTAEGETAVQRAVIERINAMPKKIVTHQSADLGWSNASPLVCESDEDMRVKLEALKREPGRDMVIWGGAQLVATLASLDLIDEYRLIVQPIALGEGQALFGKLDGWRHLHLVTTRAFDTGAVMLVYSRNL